MRYLYVLGGQQRRHAYDRDEWHAYQRAAIVRVDTHTGAVKTCLEYTSPKQVCPDVDPSIVFKAGWIEGKELFVCTQTEVMSFSLPEFKPLLYLSIPAFNDVHHVRPTPSGTLLVANTGLDMVMEMTREGVVLREWDVLGEEPWARFSRMVDYRKVETTKPHRSHPNYVFIVEGEPWATRFEQKDAVCLTAPELRMALEVGKPHDGVPFNGRVYFTTVNGNVVVVDEASCRVLERLDLNETNATSKTLGWCRGLATDGLRVWVGYSRLRPTKFRENLSWIKHGFEAVGTYNTQPTRIACYDLSTGDRLQELDLELHGLNAVFCVLSAPDE